MIEELQELFKAHHLGGSEAVYWDFLNELQIEAESVTQELSIGVADKCFTKRLGQRSGGESIDKRKDLMNLGILKENGQAAFVGLVIPLFNAEGAMVNLASYRVRGRGGVSDRSADLGTGGMIWATDSESIILADHPLDLVVLRGLGYSNAVYHADLTSADFKAKLASVKKITSFNFELPKELHRSDLSIERVEKGYGSGFLFEHCRKNPTASDEIKRLLSFSSVLPVGSKKKQEKLEWRKDGGFYFVDIENRTYRIGGIEKNRDSQKLKITLRLNVLEFFHIDTLDLYKDTPRSKFIEKASKELGDKQEVLKKDLGKITYLAEKILLQISAHKDAKPSVELTPAQQKQASEYLEDEKLFDLLKADLQAMALDGKEALAGYLAATSRFCSRPLSIISPSVGFIESLSSLIPDESLLLQSQLTPKSLFYLGDENLQSQAIAVTGSQKLSIEFAQLLETGSIKLLTVERDQEINAKASKTRSVEGFPMMILHEDCTTETIKSLCLSLRSNATSSEIDRSAEGYTKREDRRKICQKHHSIQRLLHRLPVVNNFAAQLSLSSPRSMSKELYLRLIDAVCLLRQRQKDLVKLESGAEVLEVDLEDIKIANDLAKDLFRSHSLDDLPATTRQSFELLCADLKTRKVETFSRSDFRKLVGCGISTAKNHLDRLEQAEFITGKAKQGKTTVYSLLIDTPSQSSEIILTDPETLAA